MLRVKKWLHSRKNAQFEPVLIFGDEVVAVKRLSDSLQFSIHDIIGVTFSVFDYVITKFSDDNVNVFICIIWNDGSNSPETFIPINKIIK